MRTQLPQLCTKSYTLLQLTPLPSAIIITLQAQNYQLPRYTRFGHGNNLLQCCFFQKDFKTQILQAGAGDSGDPVPRATASRRATPVAAGRGQATVMGPSTCTQQQSTSNGTEHLLERNNS